VACQKPSIYYTYYIHRACEEITNFIFGIKVLGKLGTQTSNSMNKAGLVEAVNAVLGTTKVQAEEVVDTVFDSIVKTLTKGDEVAIAGIGKFTVKLRKAREARNPKTGETVKVPATKVPKFSAAKALKDAVK
jgi:DNA-binding protein HU-beta